MPLYTKPNKNSKTDNFTAYAEQLDTEHFLDTWMKANGYDRDKPVTHQNLSAFTIRRMTDLPNWVGWQWEKKKDGHWTKVPYIAGATGVALKADTKVKATWRTHDVALKHARDGFADGVGFCLLESGVGAFDIDNCIDDKGVIHPYALELVRKAKSYTEKTVGGKGLRILGKTGTKYLQSKQKVPDTNISIECYRWCPRYITVSGLHLKGTPNELNSIDALLDEVHAKLGNGADTTSPQPDEVVVDDEPPATDEALNFLEASLPADLRDEIQIDAEVTKRSDQFYHAVKWLKDLKVSLADVIALLEKYPDGIANRYITEKRLHKEVKRAYGKPDKEPPNTKDKDDAGTKDAKTKKKLIQSSEEFTRGFIAPDYLLDGVLLRGFVYSLTARTGDGKTAVGLTLSAAIAQGKDFAGHEVAQGRVLYFAGENPDDVCMRWIAMAEHQCFDSDTIDVHFISGVFDIAKLEKKIIDEVTALGGVSFVVIDTGPAYFQGDNENDNVEMIEHAQMLRRLKDLPGNPTVLAATHPVKNAGNDNLQPRGGGGFLNAMDGNLCCWKDDMLVTLHHQGKFRGVDFEPMMFELQGVIARRLVDSKGRHIPSVIANDLSKEEQREKANELHGDEDAILILLINRKTPTIPISSTDIADSIGWYTAKNLPNKSKVQRLVKNLLKGKLVKTSRDGVVLTKEGQAAAALAKDRDDGKAEYERRKAWRTP